MGIEYRAACQCGVETIIMIGGVRSNYLTNDPFPFLCEDCHTIVEINTLDKEIQCPKCKSAKVIRYDDPSMSDAPNVDPFMSDPPKNKLPEKRAWYWFWRTKPEMPEEQKERKKARSLEQGNYKCPRCGQMTLRFTLYCFCD